MGCEKAQLVLIIEHVERRLESKMKRLGIPENQRREVLMEIERIKNTVIKYGIEQIQRELKM
ncbi:MAG: hypothetical protein B6U89_05655 [Desulfurococcales archaeon ex4484_58]|nr:MAG: hypothetical protein B6U89_05655 [Desulfurococcales archaeon ex4484_58]